MNEVTYVEFLYDHGTAIDRDREVWNAASADSALDVSVPPSYPDDEFPDGDEFWVSVTVGDNRASGRLSPSDPDDEDHPAAAPAVPCLELTLTTEELTWDDYPVTEEVEATLKLVEALYRATDTPPASVYGLSFYHAEALRGGGELPVTEADLAANRIRGTSWLMLFPPAMVETYGRELLLDAPVWHAEELADGAVLLAVIENPTEITWPDRYTLAEHLGLLAPE